MRLIEAQHHHAQAVAHHDRQEGHAVDLAQLVHAAGQGHEHQKADGHEGQGHVGVALERRNPLGPLVQDDGGQVALLAHGGHQARGARVGGVDRREERQAGIHDQHVEQGLAA
ncbi:hypothetical protein D3C86_1690740 [compost metagenome]